MQPDMKRTKVYICELCDDLTNNEKICFDCFIKQEDKEKTIKILSRDFKKCISCEKFTMYYDDASLKFYCFKCMWHKNLNYLLDNSLEFSKKIKLKGLVIEENHLSINP